MSIGKKIKNARIDKMMTQQALADAAGMAKSMLCQYENDHVMPREATLSRIAQALGLGYEYFTQDMGEPAVQALAAESAAGMILGEPGERLEEKIKSQGGAWELLADENGVFSVVHVDGISATLSPDAAEMLNAEIDRFIDFRLREFCRRKER